MKPQHQRIGPDVSAVEPEGGGQQGETERRGTVGQMGKGRKRERGRATESETSGQR